MKMKAIVIALGLFVLAPELWACSLAYQQRLFPMGSIKKDLVFMQTQLTRDSKRQGGVEIVYWTGSIQVVKYRNDAFKSMLMFG